MTFNFDHLKSPSLSLSMNSSMLSDITPKRKPSSKCSLTPMGSITEESENKKELTPLPINPFGVKAESLYFHSCSPFFATLSRNKKNDGTFRWSIEQLSVLCPADIDESSLPDTNVDSEQEMKAQKAIDAFFSQKSIVPSPWDESPSVSGAKKGIKLRRASRMTFDSPAVNSCDTATQTALSIPPDVDLQKILGKYFTFNDEEESLSSRENSREEDPLSTSSLRRKLFATEEECISPTRAENKNLFKARLWSTPSSKMQSMHSTPASDVLSSSPISPPLCSDSCNILSPPPISPITANHDCTSVQMKSFEEQSNSEIFYSPEKVKVAPENEMSFLTESQDANPFPSSTSEKQDTGYVTGSISSSQNMNFSEVNNGFISRIAPVMELMEECELYNSNSCDMSFRSTSIGDSLLYEDHKNVPAGSACNLQSCPWVPTCASTPAQGFHNL